MTVPLADAMFRPRSVALVGASADADKVGSRPLRYLRANGFGRPVHAVNPKGGEIDGVAVLPDLDALPEVPDHAYVLTGPDAALDALEICVRMGVPLVSILSGGFGEAGPLGAAREGRLRAVIAGSDTRVLGPNCMGLANPATGLTLTANASFGRTRMHPGGVMLASQSGSMIGTLLSRGAARGMGFSRLVSVGNEIDLDAAEVCLACVEDPDVTGFALFLETVRSGEALSRLAHAAAAAGKPVTAMKTGRSAVGRALAATHTGAMLGEDDMADAALADLGIARVHQMEALLEALPLMARPNLPRPRRVSVVTTTGGGAALVADRLGLAGVDLAAPGAAGQRALVAAGIEAHEAWVTDLTLAGARPEVLDAAIGALMGVAEREEIGALVVAIGSSAAADPDAIMPAILRHGHGPVPLAIFVVPEAPRALELAGEAGVAAFRTPEACADAVAALLRRRPPRAGIEVQAARDGRMLGEGESLSRISALGIAGPDAVEVATDAIPEPLPFDGPYVLKMSAPAVGHKTELGGVALGVADRAAVVESAERMADRVQNLAGKRLDRVRIVRQVRPIAEFLVGFRKDPVFGPVIMLSSGGTDAELATHRAIRLAPVDLDTARDMIASLQMVRRLEGWRGGPAADVEALAHAIVALSAPGEDVLEAEINPLGVMAEGVLALDGLMVVRQAT